MTAQNFTDKSECGFTGLINQGATCYLNSLIQSLYMIPEFRSALYQFEYRQDSHGSEERCLTRQVRILIAHIIKGGIIFFMCFIVHIIFRTNTHYNT